MWNMTNLIRDVPNQIASPINTIKPIITHQRRLIKRAIFAHSVVQTKQSKLAVVGVLGGIGLNARVK